MAVVKTLAASSSWRLSQGWALALALGLTVLIGACDYVTTYQCAVSPFYLLPIGLACWKVGRRAGLFFASLCTLVWLAAELATVPFPYTHPLIPYWNALMLLLFFVAVVYSLTAFLSAHTQLQEALAVVGRHNENLQQAVRQRTAALEAEVAERRRLEQANLRAERLAMVGTIAAQVAHEVRNPLGSITLNLDLLAKELERLGGPRGAGLEEGRTLVSEIREEVRRIQRVIEEYLQFARLPKLQPKPVKLNALLEHKLAFMEPAFSKAGVQLRTEFDADLKTVEADAEQLWQALLNLVQNSLEAMPGGGTLALSTRRENGHALLRLSDSGKGMSEQQLKQIVEPFFSTKPKGTGLGLPLTQRILHEHGAEAECASAPGHGTTFTIRFPLSKAA